MIANTFINNNNMKLCVNIYIQSMHLPNLYILVQECQIEINFTQTWGNVQKKEFKRKVDDGKTLQILNRPH